jgi:1,2-diacylglycerol 3-alpha-glucosyltransferase
MQKEIRSILFVLPSLLHYHFPRFRHLATVCRQAGITFTHVELCSHLKAYPWLVDDPHNQFTNITLFPDRYLEEIPGDRLWEALEGQLEILRPDVLFLYGYSLGVFRKALNWARKERVPVVTLSDSNIFDKRRYKPFEYLKSLFVRQFDAALVGGTSSREYMRTLGIPRERCVFGMDVIDTEFFGHRSQENLQKRTQLLQKWNLPEKYFLFVGRLIPEKNLLVLLKAYRKYVSHLDGNERIWHLALCGSGPEEEKINETLQEFPEDMRNLVHLLGHVDQPEVIEPFSLAAGLVLPSRSESWGLVINEALACGIPVLVSDRCGCARDLVRNAENGWTFDPAEEETLTARMETLSRLDDVAWAKMSRCGLEISAGWGLDRFSQGTLESARIAMAHRRSKA